MFWDRGRLILPRLAVLALVSLGLVACGDGNDKAPSAATANVAGKLTAVLATADLAVGPQRLSFVVLDGDVPVTDKSVYVRFFKDASKQARVVGEGPIPWTPLGAKEDLHAAGGHDETELTGIYYVNIEFDEPGDWGIGISLGEQPNPAKEIRVGFTVKQRSQAVGVGEKAVAVKNPTSKDRPLKQIHTRADADPDFHTMNIAEAVSSGKPSIIVFATPSFCRTRTCGPALQVAMKAALAFQGKANFVHVEPYELDANGDLAKDAQGNQFKLVEASTAWRLPSEPWAFVVDRTGTVVARFEGPYGIEELDAAIAGVTN